MQQEIRVVGLARELGVALLIAATSIASQRIVAAEAMAHWHCRYDGDKAINCTLKPSPAAIARGQPLTTEPVNRGGTAPADAKAGRLPAVVQTIRDNSVALAGKQVRIPLHTELTDIAFARQLTQAVMCGARASCSVEFESTLLDPAKLSAVELADRTDTALEE